MMATIHIPASGCISVWLTLPGSDVERSCTHSSLVVQSAPKHVQSNTKGTPRHSSNTCFRVMDQFLIFVCDTGHKTLCLISKIGGRACMPGFIAHTTHVCPHHRRALCPDFMGERATTTTTTLNLIDKLRASEGDSNHHRSLVFSDPGQKGLLTRAY